MGPRYVEIGDRKGVCPTGKPVRWITPVPVSLKNGGTSTPRPSLEHGRVIAYARLLKFLITRVGGAPVRGKLSAALPPPPQSAPQGSPHITCLAVGPFCGQLEKTLPQTALVGSGNAISKLRSQTQVKYPEMKLGALWGSTTCGRPRDNNWVTWFGIGAA